MVIHFDSQSYVGEAIVFIASFLLRERSVNRDDLNSIFQGQLSLEIERERHEYLEKSKHLNEQLQTLKGEIDALKVDDKVTPLDVHYQEQQELGNTKYSTIQKVKRGSATSRYYGH